MPLLKNLISLLIVCDGGCHPSPNSKFAAWKIREDLMNEISMKNFHKRVKLYTFVV